MCKRLNLPVFDIYSTYFDYHEGKQDGETSKNVDWRDFEDDGDWSYPEEDDGDWKTETVSAKVSQAKEVPVTVIAMKSSPQIITKTMADLYHTISLGIKTKQNTTYISSWP